MLKCYVLGKNLINGTPEEYKIAEGAVFTDNYNETLDSGTIILPQLDHEIDIEPFDIVIIYSTNDSNVKIIARRMCVDTIKSTQTSLNPAIYKYEISLFSETKLLENYLLPSLAISKNVDNPRTVKDYLNRYLFDYGPKNYSNLETGAWTPGFSMSAEVIAKFDAIVCPEMQWNTPTLREVLTDLMMVADCIPILRNNVIYMLDISEIGSEITDAQKQSINYVSKTLSSADYASDLKVNAINAMNVSNYIGTGESYDDAPKDATIINEFIGFRNDESYLLTTENCRVETNFPIWKLYYVEAKFKITARVTMHKLDEGSEDFYVDVYVTRVLKNKTIDFVPEFGIWQTKNIKYGSFASNEQLNAAYQNTCLYYKRGSKGIFNFNAKVEKQVLWISSQTSVLTLLGRSDEITAQIAAKAEEEHSGWTFDYIYSQSTPEVAETFFRVVYEPVDECTFLARKEGAKNTRQVFDNQTNSYIDIDRQGILEYLKANRLGNKVKLINGRYKVNESLMPALAQKFDNSIIFRKEIEVHNNYINVNYQATDNYVLKDYFTGVKSKLRSWRIVDGNEALIRADVIKLFCGPNVSDVNMESTNERELMLEASNFRTVDNVMYGITHALIKFNTSDGARPNHSQFLYNGQDVGIDYYLVEIAKNRCGKSALITIKMPDNSFVGKFIGNPNETGGAGQKNAFYTDRNGETQSGVIYLYDHYFNDPGADWYGGTPNKQKSNMLPCVNSGQGSYWRKVARIPFYFPKDQKEIFQLTLQFEFDDEYTNVFTGK